MPTTDVQLVFVPALPFRNPQTQKLVLLPCPMYEDQHNPSAGMPSALKVLTGFQESDFNVFSFGISEVQLSSFLS